MKLKITEVRAKSVLTPSKLPGADWVINPYVGCTFGCKYCYAAFIGRWKHPGEEWGEFLDVKINAPEVLVEELKRLERKRQSKDFGTILFSSVTDPYVGQEAKYQITRKCLEVLIGFGYEGEVAILTKSPLVVRDVDLFKELKASVGLTVTTLDDKVSQFLEGKAPPSSSRLKALEKLNVAEVDTYVFVGPILPCFTARADKLEELFSAIEQTGTREIWLEHINLNPKIKERLFRYLKDEAPELMPEFQKANTQEYRRELEKVVREALKGKGFKLAFGRIIYHREPQTKKPQGFRK